jgi:type VI secretion system secreted protein VgrG
MPHAGKQFGFITIPRTGQEVIVAFEEGDPDQPIVVGSVYNADMMPPYALPDFKTRSTFKSRSSIGGGGFNELRFEDKKDAEQVFFHAQKNMDVRVLADRMEWIGNDTHLIVKRDQVEAVERDVQRKVSRNVVEEIGQDRILVIKGKDAVQVTGARTQNVMGNSSSEIGGDQSSAVSGKTYIKGKDAIVVESDKQITLKVGGNFVDISPSGVTITGTMVNINSGGAAGSGSKGSLNPTKAPATAKAADTAESGGHKTYSGSGGGGAAGPSGRGSTAPPPPTHNPTSPENKEKTHWIGIRLKDRTGKPVPGQAYKVVLPNGEVSEGTLDDEGKAKIEHIDPGNCQVSFPGLADWKKA